MTWLVALVERDLPAVAGEPVGERGAEDPGADDGGALAHVTSTGSTLPSWIRQPASSSVAEPEDQVRTALPRARCSRCPFWTASAPSPGGNGRRRARSPRPPGRSRRGLAAGARTGTGSRACSLRASSARRRRPGTRRARRPRWAPPPARVRRAARGSRRGLPPDRGLHGRFHVLGGPERRRQVLPAAVGEHADDDALVELLAPSSRATCTTAPEEIPAKIASWSSSARTPATESAFVTRSFRSSIVTSRIGGT